MYDVFDQGCFGQKEAALRSIICFGIHFGIALHCLYRKNPSAQIILLILHYLDRDSLRLHLLFVDTTLH